MTTADDFDRCEAKANELLDLLDQVGSASLKDLSAYLSACGAKDVRIKAHKPNDWSVRFVPDEDIAGNRDIEGEGETIAEAVADAIGRCAFRYGRRASTLRDLLNEEEAAE